MEFRIALRSIAQRRLHVELAFERPADRDSIELFMPVWTPGSYLVREYARHVVDFVATDGIRGIGLPVEKSAKNRYRVDLPEGCERVLVRYQIYAHSLTVREAWVGEEFAYWNGACTYFWPVGWADRGASVRVDLPDGWKLFAGSAQGSDRFEVANLDEAVDTPCLALAEPQVLEFDALGRPHRFVCAGLGPITPPASLVKDSVRIIEEAAKVFGRELPFDEYSFLSLFGANGRGGLEHRDSSTLLAPRTTFGARRDYEDFMSLVAHEFFHIWNVKRMRPAELMEFDYEREQYTSLLWVAEGMTAYFDDHLCLRAGLFDARRYLEIVTSHVRNMRTMPGRFVQSLSESSFDAWVRFYRQDENTRNSTQNYYSNGALAAICVDAWIRDGSDGERSLDDAIAALYTATVERGYAIEDVIAVVSEAAGRDLEAQLRTLVEGPFDPDLDAVLAVYGLEFDVTDRKQARLGVQFRRGSTTLATVFDGTPACLGGLAPGDEILALGSLRVAAETWASVFRERARVGEPLRVLIAREGIVSERDVVPAADDLTTLQIRSVADPDERQLRLRAGWLGDATIPRAPDAS